MFRLFLVLIALAGVCVGFAEPREFASVTLATPPTIDGIVDEAEWTGAISGEGAIDILSKGPAPESMKFWITMDDKAIYFAARMNDSEPNNIVAQETRKNVSLSGNDSITLVLDVLGTLTDFNIFTINAAGGSELKIAGGRAAKAEWLGEIITQGRKTQSGWEAEARIPWKIMRLPGAGKRAIRFNVRRYFARFNRDFAWTLTDGDGLQNIGRITDVELPKPDEQRTLQLLPYSYIGHDEDGFIFNNGLDFKTKLMDRLELVGSINPDFRNIENQVLSLGFSYFERLAGETRPFFAEGSSYFTTGYDSRLFASQRIASFDAGVKVFGKLSDKSQFGIMDLHTFGQQNAFVGSYRYFPEARTNLDVAFTSLRREGVSNDGFFTNYSKGIGPNLYYVNAMTTTDAQFGTGTRFTTGFFSEVPGRDFYFDFTNIDERFNPRMGFNAERDVRGVSSGGGLTQTQKNGPVAQTSWFLNGGVFWHMNGDPYRRTISASGNLALRNGLQFDLQTEKQRFETFNDEFYRLAVNFPRGNRYRQYSFAYVNGVLSGQRFVAHSLSANLQPMRDLQIGAVAQFVKHFDDATQIIASANYDLHRNRAISARIVRQNDDWNGYVSFRQSGGLGTEYFLIVGDPNARTFRSSVILKVTTPFDLRI